MDETFDFQDKLFNLFVADTELPTLLNITDITDMSLCNDKLRRQQQDSTLITTEMLDFIDFSFIDAGVTKNILVNRGLLEINIYSQNRYFAGQIKKRINKILKDNFEIQIIAEGQISMPTTGIYGYRVRYKPLIWS